jgi:hypothetical protein
LVLPAGADAIQRRDAVLDLMVAARGADSADRKQWLLDQVLRLLAGVEYRDIVIQIEVAHGRAWDLGESFWVV